MWLLSSQQASSQITEMAGECVTLRYMGTFERKEGSAAAATLLTVWPEFIWERGDVSGL